MAWLPLLLCLAATAKLLVLLADGSDGEAAGASLILALGLAALTAWVYRSEPHAGLTRSIAAPPQIEPARLPQQRAAPFPARDPAERRRHPRRAVRCEIELEWHRHERERARLHDLSRGGARVHDAAAAAIGRRGLMHVPGLSLPVPFTVVECLPQTGLHIRFDLEGMGLEAMEQQLDDLLDRAAVQELPARGA